MPNNKELIELLDKASETIGLESGFFDHLMSLSDWVFILTVSTLFEAALLEGIIKKLKNEEIRENISHLELANTKCSKIERSISLDIISKSDAKFIRKIAEIRNLLAHRIDQRHFNIADYIKTECKDNRNKLNSLTKTLSHRLKDQICVRNGKKENKADAIIQIPKHMITANTMDILANLTYLHSK